MIMVLVDAKDGKDCDLPIEALISRTSGQVTAVVPIRLVGI